MSTVAIRRARIDDQVASWSCQVFTADGPSYVDFREGVARLDASDPRVHAFRGNPSYTIRELPEETS